jgi:hypothetical protein
MNKKRKMPRAIKRIQKRRVKVKALIQTSASVEPVMRGTEYEWFNRDHYSIRGEENLLRFLNPPSGHCIYRFINLKFRDGDEYTINLGSSKGLDFIYFENSQERLLSLYSASGHKIAMDLDYAINIDRVLTVLQLEGLYDREEYDTLYKKYIEPLGQTSGWACAGWSL